MAKKILSTLLLCTFCASFTSVFASNESTTNGKPSSKTTECNAPAPDSFRVTNMGSDLVTLGWIPAWTGATQTLELSIEDSGNWIVLFTNNEVPGDSYTLNELEPGYYKARIATNCVGGGTGVESTEVPIKFKIIDLTTAGRIPSNPAIVNCDNIDYTNHEWVGFKVREKETDRYNLFEFKVVEKTGLVKRVFNNLIVAVDADGNYPIGNVPLPILGFTFEMHDKSKPIGQQSIGFIEITQDNSGNNPIIGICKLDSQWKNTYEFKAMTAESVLPPVPPGGGGIFQGFGKSHINEIYAQSPFSNELNIFIPKNAMENDAISVTIVDCKGCVVLSQKIINLTNNCKLNTSFLDNGLYFLRLETASELRTIKIIKSL